MTDEIEAGPVGPGQRAPERRRRELLESAILEFSTHGIGGARIDRIAARTNSNKAMLYHYFGSKEGLYLAALQDMYAGIRREEDLLELETMEPLDAIRAVVCFTFRYHVDNPGFVRMINTENLHRAAHLRAAGDMEALNRPILQKIAAILRRGAETGVLRAGVDPLDLYISISALSFTYVANRHTLQVIFGRDLFAPDAIAARLETICDMVLRYVAADP